MMEKYSEALEVPMQKSKRNSFMAGLNFGFGMGTPFCVYALVFWYETEWSDTVTIESEENQNRRHPHYSMSIILDGESYLMLRVVDFFALYPFCSVNFFTVLWRAVMAFRIHKDLMFDVAECGSINPAMSCGAIHA